MSQQAPADAVFINGYRAKQCPTRIQNDYDLNLDPEDKDPTSPFQLSIMERGNEYEDPTIKTLLMEAHPSNVTIDVSSTARITKAKLAGLLEEARSAALVLIVGDREEKSKALREDVTHALLENPGKVTLIFNPRLRMWKKDSKGRKVWAERVLEPDIIYRQNSSRAKSAKWNSIDIKWHNPFEGESVGGTWLMSPLSAPFPQNGTEIAWTGHPQKQDAYQLAHYHRGLEFFGFAGEPTAGIIGKALDGEIRVVWIDLNENLYERGTASALTLYDASFAHVLAVAKRKIAQRTDPTLADLAPPEWKAECSECPWNSVCHQKLVKQDHISLLPRVTPRDLDKHYEAGVVTVPQLANLNTPTAKIVEAGVSRLGELITVSKTSAITDTVLDAVVALDPAPSERARTKIVDTLAQAGITTAAQLARLHPTTALYSPGIKGLVRAIDQARVVDYASNRRSTHVFLERGVDSPVCPDAPVRIHVDMENEGPVYLWGMLTEWRYKGGRERRDYHPYVDWSGTFDGEAVAFAEFWAGLMGMIQKAQAQEGEKGVIVTHYTPAEDRCMQAIAKRHEGKPGIPTLAEVDAFLASDIWVDLYVVLTKQLVWPTEDMKLKSLAHYIRFVWRDSDPSGANSVIWYQRAIDETDPEHEEFRTRVLEYNEDDVRANAALLSWFKMLTDLNQPRRKGAPERKIAKVEDLEMRYQRSR